MTENVFFLFILLYVFPVAFGAFTCQGNTYNIALTKCPDSGTQRMSSGGNVTILVKSANNLKNLDSGGPSAGVSDPYVVFKAGSTVLGQSNWVSNSLNPVWNEEVNLGVLGSAHLIDVEIWNYNIGALLGDTLLTKSQFRVPFCSAFDAPRHELSCKDPFACESDDSSWHMPLRPRCTETGHVNFNPERICAKGSCLQIDIEIIPLNVSIPLSYPHNLTEDLQLTVLSNQASWTGDGNTPNDVGHTFLGTTNKFDMKDEDALYLKGALMVQQRDTAKYTGLADTPLFYLAVNFPSYVYVCRSEYDNDNGIPTWLTRDGWNSRNISITRLYISPRLGNEDLYFGCFFMEHPGTVRNKYGGVVSNPILMHTNTIVGHDDGDPFKSGFYKHNYVVLVVPRDIVSRVENIVVTYDSAIFVDSLFSYGLIFYWFMNNIAEFLDRISFSVDQIMPFLLSRTIEGENKSLLATLFVSNGNTPCNIEFRSHLFHARNSILFILTIPFWLLMAWGFSVAAIAQPFGLGYGVAFLGMGGVSLWFGYRLWETNSWRMTPIAVAAHVAAIFFLMIYLFTVILVDPAVTIYGHYLNFPALSILFGTLNTMPLFLLVFRQDRTYKIKLKFLMDLMSEAATVATEPEDPSPAPPVYMTKAQKEAAALEASLPKKVLPINRSIHALLGDGYTIYPKVPMYQFGAVIQEPVKDNTDVEPVAVAVPVGEQPPAPKEELHEVNETDRKLYNMSLFVLFVYLMIAAGGTEYPSQAFVNCLSLILLDTIHTSLSSGEVNWSPAYKLGLLVAGRLLIMSSDGDSWVMNYSLCYMVYAGALASEVINDVLPMLSKRQAGDIAFSGVEEIVKINDDLVGTAQFSFLFLTFFFIGLMLVAGIGATARENLPAPPVLVFNLPWPAFAFGMIAILVTVCGALAGATIRAFYLQKHGLLKGWARDSFLLRQDLNIPNLLAICTEISILVAGILIYGVTDSAIVVVFAIFVPPIAVCLGHSYQVWVKNQYDLVIWPPLNLDPEEFVEDEVPEVDSASLQMEGLFASLDEVEEIAPDRTVRGFKLPPMEVTGKVIDDVVKMPPLPLKSVLRKKREMMGIKIKKPLVKDLKGREGVENVDKFGAGNVIEAPKKKVKDPYALFEDSDSDDDEETRAKKLAARKKKKVGTAYEIDERGGFMNHPWVLEQKEAWNNSRAGQILNKCSAFCFAFMKKRYEKYSKIAPPADDDALVGEVQHNAGGTNFHSMPFINAVLGGFLTTHEYYALCSWFGGLFLIFLMGVTIGSTVYPSWFGHFLWCSCIIIIFTVVPIIKYFNTFKVDLTMKYMGYFLIAFHCVFTLAFFLDEGALNGDGGTAGSLWLLDYFLYYPGFVYICFEIVAWKDGGFILQPLDEDGDGDVTMQEYINFFKAYPVLIVMMIMFNWQLYLWINGLVGMTFTLFVLVCCVGFCFVWDWASNDFFLSTPLAAAGDAIIKATMFFSFVSGLFGSTPLFSMSIFYFAFIFRCCTKVAARIMTSDPDTIIFFSPLVMPIYSYDPHKNDVLDETPSAKQVLYALVCAIIWGSTMASFLYPVDVGVAMACLFLLIVTGIIVSAVSFVPLQLGSFANMLSMEIIREAAASAHERFENRKLPLNMEMADWVGPKTKNFKPPGSAELDISKTCIAIAGETLNAFRSLSYVRDDTPPPPEKKAPVEEDDEVNADGKPKKPSWIMVYIQDTIRKIFRMFVLNPLGKKKIWKVHSEALFRLSDAIAEPLLTGKGSFGFVGVEGEFFKLFKKAQDHPNLHFLRQPWLNSYDLSGNDRTVTLLNERFDHVSVMKECVVLNSQCKHAFKEETRCAVHFLLMLLVAADAKMQREQVLFQKFLRENRANLAANGISPPADIFSSSSFASIDISLVAVWLSTLTVEERQLFHELKATFSGEQLVRDEAIDNEDYERTYEAYGLKTERLAREEEMYEEINSQILKMQADRVDTFADSLDTVERTKFGLKRELWTQNADCFVAEVDVELHRKFQQAVMNEKDEPTVFARETLAEIEAAQHDCRIGEYGRSYQFVDPDFMPGTACIDDADLSSQMMGWRCAPGINESASLFQGGTDPDDVNVGIFEDEWLLAAINMLAAAGGVDNGEIDPQILNLFIGHYTPDGELIHRTEVGGYCLRLFKRGMWTPIIVDDVFPMLKQAKWNDDNVGIASAYSKECEVFWVSLIEKAFAKYYGSYAHLKRGFVHHALEDMTGCDAECVSLCAAGRGIGKRALWDLLVRSRKNGYILGAGTGSSDLADAEIQNMGIVFNAAYTLYDIRVIDGFRLLKLRNPPGDHEEWKGDWSDKSLLWTKRLKHKLDLVDEDDNTFWMCFDDFCNVFRHLYVCKWYDMSSWGQIQFPGMWKIADIDRQEKEEATRAQMVAEGLASSEHDEKKQKHERAIAMLDTAGGLPTAHNPGCELENNPHFALHIFRPTDLRITVSQVDSRGQSMATVVPFAIYVVKNEHDTTPMRVKIINNDNVICCTGVPKEERTQHLYTFLEPGLYIVLIPAYMKGMEGNFTVTMLSNKKLVFDPFYPPKWMIKAGEKMGDAQAGSNAANEFSGMLSKVLQLLVGDEQAESSEEESDEEDEEKGKSTKGTSF